MAITRYQEEPGNTDALALPPIFMSAFRGPLDIGSQTLPGNQ
ncbi:MAG: hypothetical protein U7126_10630 [Microcoleus sp.]